MLYPVCLSVQEENRHQIVAPDFRHLVVLDTDRSRALTRMQLRIEGAVSELLIRGAAAPTPSNPAEFRSDPEFIGCEVLQIDIHPLQLQAVARHQTRR